MNRQDYQSFKQETTYVDHWWWTAWNGKGRSTGKPLVLPWIMVFSAKLFPWSNGYFDESTWDHFQTVPSGSSSEFATEHHHFSSLFINIGPDPNAKLRLDHAGRAGRRMCCSRVCNVRRYAGFPRRSKDSPIKRPGMRRTWGWGVPMRPQWSLGEIPLVNSS